MMFKTQQTHSFTAAAIALFAFALPTPTFAADWVLVAGAKSGINKIDADAASNLYLGKVNELAGVGPVTLMDLPEGNPIRDSFYADTTKKDASALKAYWSRMIFTGKGQPPRAMDGAAAIKKALSANSTAIAYIEKSAVDASVKVLLTP